MADSILVVDDDQLLLQELARYFRRQGWEVALGATLAAARDMLVDRGFDPLVVVADMSLPDGNGLDLLEELQARERGGEWIVLTGYGSVPDSVRALRLGAFDFLEKPCDPERLDVVVNGAARSARAQRRLRDQAAAASRRYTPESFIGRSEPARRVQELLGKLTQVPFSALVIGGETGTGKGLAARILHHGGARADGPMVEVNCAALPRELLESELFGHEAGAFTGAKGRHRGLLEQAHQGTLFLDEIGDMDLDLQSKLLKAIEDQTVRRLGGNREIHVDVQIIAASHRDLEQAVADGLFRADLYHRLSVFRLDLPPLRERKADLEDLVPELVAQYNAKAGKSVKVIPDGAWEEMRGHDWPGNVRELRNVVERCVLFADSDVFPTCWLQLDGGRHRRPPDCGGTDTQICLPLDGSMALDDMERQIIATALQRNGHNVTATARALGATRETIRYRVQKYALHTTDEPAATPE